MQDIPDILGGASLPGTPYSLMLMTDMSRRLDDLFGFRYREKIVSYRKRLMSGTLELTDIDEPGLFLQMEDILSVLDVPSKGLTGEIIIPVSREVEHNLKSARSFMIAYEGTETVVDFFSSLSQRTGCFFALSTEEILAAPGGLERGSIAMAKEEGYARAWTYHLGPGKETEFLELTDKFSPLEKRLGRRQTQAYENILY